MAILLLGRSLINGSESSANGNELSGNNWEVLCAMSNLGDDDPLPHQLHVLVKEETTAYCLKEQKKKAVGPPSERKVKGLFLAMF